MAPFGKERPRHLLLIAALVLLVLIVVLPGPLGTHRGFMGIGPLWWSSFWLWGIVMLGFWILLVVVVWVAVTTKGQSVLPGIDSPLDVLKRRYAAGEVTREQFEQMRKDLES